MKGNGENRNITPLNPSRIPGLMFLCKREEYKKMYKDNQTKKGGNDFKVSWPLTFGGKAKKIIAHSYWCLCSKFSFNSFNHAGEALMWVHSVCFVQAQIGQCWSVHLGVSQSSGWCSCWLQWEHTSLSSWIIIGFDFDPSIPLLLSPLISSLMPAWCNVDDLGVGNILTWLKDGGAGREGERPWEWNLSLRQYS